MIEYEKCKSALACKLVNVRSGIRCLSQVPFAPAFADMAMTACILTQNRKKEDCFIPVTNQIAAEWGVSPSQILETARKNTFRILPPKIYPMREIMLSQRDGSVFSKVESILSGEYQGTDKEALQALSYMISQNLCDKYENSSGIANMWVLSNREWIFGASGLLYPRVLETFAHTHQESFYIIPSSIHEVILIPRSMTVSEGYLKEMLQIINESVLTKDRFLADCVYYYDKNSLEIRCL